MKDRFDARLERIPPAAFHAMLVRIAEIDEFKGWWSGFERSAGSILDTLEARAVGAAARASTWVEGAGKAARPGDRSLTQRAGVGAGAEGPASLRARGYAEELRAVFEGYGEMQFGEELTRVLHAKLTRHSDQAPDDSGKREVGRGRGASLRTRANLEAVALRPSAPDRVPAEMEALLQWTAAGFASKRFHPLLVIAGFVLEFLSIRPFAEANGRLSRLLTQLLLLQSGYVHLRYFALDKVIAERWTEYYLALRHSQANRNRPEPDISAWLLAFVDALCAHAAELRKMVRGQPDERLLSRNQLAVLGLLRRNGEVTNRLICSELSLARETAKQVLNRLVALNLIRRAGAGRAVRYLSV